MTSFDYVVLAITGLSILLSMMRGFVREIFALVIWVAAIYAAKMYALQLAQLLPTSIPSEPLRLLAAFLILFLAALLASTLLAIGLSHLFKKLDLTWLDRCLGCVFGLARGIVTVLVFLAGFTAASKDARWRNAMLAHLLRLS